jgi:HTH-type transcriptional regulator/antitoxin HigA
LLAWQAHILQKYGADEVDDFFLDALDDSFFNELLSFSMYPKGPLLVKDYLYAYGIRFVVEPHLPKTYVDGAAFASHDGKPLVVLSLRYDRVDNFWFTLLHELAHVVKHLYGGADDRAFFDDTSSNPKECESLLEQEANDFAMEYLIPATRVDVQALGDASAWSPSKILATAKELKRSPAILAGRIRYETGNYGLFSEMLGAKGLKCLFT